LRAHGEVVTPAVEELLQLGIGGRDADVQAPVVAGPVQLIDRALNHLASQRVDLHLVPQLEVLEEHRDPERLARDRGPGLATAALSEKPVGVIRAGGPQVPAHRLAQLAHGLEFRLDRLVRHSSRRAGEHEAGDQVLLEGVQIPVTRHRPGRRRSRTSASATPALAFTNTQRPTRNMEIVSDY
jgi:hypothetical protein